MPVWAVAEIVGVQSESLPGQGREAGSAGLGTYLGSHGLVTHAPPSRAEGRVLLAVHEAAAVSVAAA